MDPYYEERIPLENFDEIHSLAMYIADNAARSHHVKFYMHHKTIARKLNLINLKITEIKSGRPDDPTKYHIQGFSNPYFNSQITTDFSELLYQFVVNVWPKSITDGKAKFDQLLQAFDESDCDNISELIRKFLHLYNFEVTNKNTNSEEWRTVGKISYDPNSYLGKGEGTKVYKGKFENHRDVAVKRITCDSTEVKQYENEIKMLVRFGLDSHPNIVNYFATEVVKDDDFKFLIALELCDLGLNKWVQPDGNTDLEFFQMNSANQCSVLKQTTTGANFLHLNNVIHRDIKPENILLKQIGEAVYVKISDFGISRKIPDGRTSMTNYTGSGTVGWMAPEILKLRNQKEDNFTKIGASSDIFSLGCIFHYVLTKGFHIFGDLEYRNGNILDGKRTVEKDKLELSFLGCVPLMEMMTTMEPQNRPSGNAILNHHIFWSTENILGFLCTVSDMLAGLDSTGKKKITELLSLKNCTYSTDETDEWISCMNPKVQKILTSAKFCKYERKSVASLLRAIRNLHNHFYQQTKEVQDTLGEPPNAYLNYWTFKFPLLVNYTWENFQVVGSNPSLQPYYKWQGKIPIESMTELQKSIYEQFSK